MAVTYLYGGDLSIEPLKFLLDWVQALRNAGKAVVWKDDHLENHVSLNIA